MTDIKQVIHLLCKHLRLLLSVDVQPEVLRLAKYDRNEDSCVKVLWLLLYETVRHLCSTTTSVGEASEESKVVVTKRLLLQMGYQGLNFYLLPSSMESGSCELLIALAWVLAAHNALEVLVTRRITKSVLNMEYNPTVTADFKRQPDLRMANLSEPCNVQYLLWLAGRLQHHVCALNELNDERISKTAKIHEDTVKTSGFCHLSAYLMDLAKHQEKIPEFLKMTAKDVQLIEVHFRWKLKEKVFWEWMGSVVVENSRNQEGKKYTLNKDSKLVVLQVVSLLQENMHSKTHCNTEDTTSGFGVRKVVDESTRFWIGDKCKRSDVSKWTDDLQKSVESKEVALSLKQLAIQKELSAMAENWPGTLILYPRVGQEISE